MRQVEQVRFTILMYHIIDEPRSNVERRFACPPSRFARHMRYLHRHGFSFVSMAKIEAFMAGINDLPPNAVCITLDDGFHDNYEHAFHTFQEYDIPATIFLVSDTIGRTNRWMSGRGFPERSMLKWSQIEEMASAGVEFGGHTRAHPRLIELTLDRAGDEIRRGKQEIENRLGRAVRHFAYPYGLLNRDVRNLVEDSGFSLACSTRSGFNSRNTDPYILHRIEIYGMDPLWKLRQKLTFGINDASIAFPATYYARRILAKVRELLR